MKKNIKVTLPLLLWMVVSFSQTAQAEQVCQVTDPTGTPLNVRAAPNGRIVQTIANGREVSISDTRYDRKDRSWVLISAYQQGSYRTLGWVFREFVSCYNR